VFTNTRARIVPVVVVLWLIIGAIAAGQRHYYSSSSTNCANVGTVLVTIVAGPLNYLGVNPKISHCTVPTPSK
jgi:membrane protein YdbS with pleckstrin-like domain